MTLASRYPIFLYEALKLQEPQLPKNVDESLIQSMIDVYQNGWALAVYNHRQFTWSAQFDTDQVLIGDGTFPPPDPGTSDELRAKKVFAIDWRADAGNPNTVSGFFKYRRLSDSAEVILTTQNIAPGSTSSWLGNISDTASREWVVPPGWQLLLSTFATGAVDNVTLNILWAEIPAGFNIGW